MEIFGVTGGRISGDYGRASSRRRRRERIRDL